MGGGRPGRPADTAAITVPTSIRQPREPAAAPLTGRLPWILIRQTVQVNIMTAELGPPQVERGAPPAGPPLCPAP